MKVLIIDNGTSYLGKIKNLIPDHNYQVISYSEINPGEIENFDAVVLSGGHNLHNKNSRDQFKKEINLIKNSTKPILGICYGSELIARAFGAKLEWMDTKERALIKIDIVKPDVLFADLPNFRVFENHRMIIKKLPDNLIALAKSPDGIEIFKHTTRPIYGMQFHPEKFVKATCGDKLFQNFLNSI